MLLSLVSIVTEEVGLEKNGDDYCDGDYDYDDDDYNDVGGGGGGGVGRDNFHNNTLNGEKNKNLDIGRGSTK